MSLAHREWLSTNGPVLMITPNTLTTGLSVNTYDTAPQPAAGIDTWLSGKALPLKIVMLINAALTGGSGTLAVSLRDSQNAITPSNGSASTAVVATLASITASGLYVAVIDTRHIFDSTTSRYTNDGQYENVIHRYVSARATSAGATWVFEVTGILWETQRGLFKGDSMIPASQLAVTYAT